MKPRVVRAIATPALLGIAMLAVALMARPTRAGQGTPPAAPARPDLIWMRGGTWDGVFSIVYSPDARFIVTVGGGAPIPDPHAGAAVVKLWRLSDGMLLRTWQRPAEAAAFSPDGQLLAIAGGDGVTFMRVDDGSPAGAIAGPG